MRFLCGDMSEGPKHVKAKTSYTVFVLSTLLRKQPGMNVARFKIFKEFARRRPLEMNKPDSPFYHAVKHQRKSDDDVWKMRSLSEKMKSANFSLATAAKNAGFQCRVTNHSVRKTCISRLLDADVPNNFVAQLSGHRSLKSLADYKSASYEH